MKVTKLVLDELCALAYRHWADNPQPRQMDNKQFVVLSYLRAVEVKLGVKFEYDLPQELETIRDDD